jgi:hypothetical protein
MIRDAYGYHDFDDRESWEGRVASKRFLAFLHGRAWTHAEGPTALFDQSVAWLRRHRVLLPGVTVLERLVGSVRERADERMYATVARQAERADSGLPGVLSELLVVPEDARVSELERLRQAPKRQSGPEMVRALRRADDLAALRLGRVAVGKVPLRRMKTLAKYGAGSKAPALARLHEPRKTATLLAVTRSLEAEAIDDALDLFALLMATKLISPARRKSGSDRLAPTWIRPRCGPRSPTRPGCPNSRSWPRWSRWRTWSPKMTGRPSPRCVRRWPASTTPSARS